MKQKYLKILFPIATALFLLTFAINAVASVDAKTASEFSQYCSVDPSVCTKVDFNETRTGTVNCPYGNMTVADVYVHAGDGQTVYKLPNAGFDYSVNSNSATVVLTTHKHNISWIGIVCRETSSTPSPTPSPSPSPSATPSPTPTPTPTPCTNCTGQEQHQEQNNTQTVNVIVPQVLPATGIGVLGMTAIFGGGPLGLMLAKYGRGRMSAKREESLAEFASRKHQDKIFK